MPGLMMMLQWMLSTFSSEFSSFPKLCPQMVFFMIPVRGSDIMQ